MSTGHLSILLLPSCRELGWTGPSLPYPSFHGSALSQGGEEVCAQNENVAKDSSRDDAACQILLLLFEKKKS